MKRFIIAIIIFIIIVSSFIINRAFIENLYSGLDKRLENIGSKLPDTDADGIEELGSYWDDNTHALSLSVKESDIRSFSMLISKMKLCKGEEYLAALANLRLLAEELRKTESLEFFDLF